MFKCLKHFRTSAIRTCLVSRHLSYDQEHLKLAQKVIAHIDNIDQDSNPLYYQLKEAQAQLQKLTSDAQDIAEILDDKAQRIILPLSGA